MVRATSSASYERLIAAVAGLAATVENLDRRFTEGRADAKEARDAAREVQSTLAAQNLPAQIAGMKAVVEKEVTGLRSDLVNAVTHIKTDMATQEAELRGEISAVGERVHVLEQAHERQTGALGLVDWLAKHAPWLAAIAAAAMAAVGLDKVLAK